MTDMHDPNFELKQLVKQAEINNDLALQLSALRLIVKALAFQAREEPDFLNALTVLLNEKKADLQKQGPEGAADSLQQWVAASVPEELHSHVR